MKQRDRGITSCHKLQNVAAVTINTLVDLIWCRIFPSAPRNDAGERWDLEKKMLRFSDKWLRECGEGKGEALDVEAPGDVVRLSLEAERLMRAPDGSGLHSVWGEIQPHLQPSHGWESSQILCQRPFSPHQVLQKLVPCWSVPLSSFGFSGYQKNR